MAEERVPVVQTPPKIKDYARAALIASEKVIGEIMTKEQVGVLWAQYFVETSAQHCYNWNIGNVKHVKGDGYNYHCLVGTWECYPIAEAQALIDSGQATLDSKPDHVATAGPGRLSIIFQPPHPFTQFRAYPSLDVSMFRHLAFLKKRFASAWPFIMAGKPRETAIALRKQGYYTASAESYAAGMASSFNSWMRSTMFDYAEAEILAVGVPLGFDLPAESLEVAVDTGREPEDGHAVA